MAARALARAAALLGGAWVVACADGPAPCNAPASGTFTVSLHYAQSLDVDIACGSAAPQAGDAALDAGDGGAAPCASHPHVLDGATIQVTVRGGTTTLAPPSGAPWTCASTAPSAAPSSAADGAPVTGTGCYLLVNCTGDVAGDSGALDTQVQILAKASGADAIALVRQTTGACCADEYTGSWSGG